MNALHEDRERLVSITVDGEISEEEAADFEIMRVRLRQLASASNTLQLWMEKRFRV